MKLGDIARLKDNKAVLGEVKVINDADVVTLSLYVTAVRYRRICAI